MTTSEPAIDPDEMPFVCPGCHCIGAEPHLPGCIDGEIEEELQDRLNRGDYDIPEGEGDWEWEP